MNESIDQRCKAASPEACTSPHCYDETTGAKLNCRTLRPQDYILNRRGFLASLFAPFVARFFPKPAHGLSLGPVFTFSTEDMALSIDEFSRRFLQPHVFEVANRCDAILLGEAQRDPRMRYWVRDPHKTPERLPA